MIGIVTSIWTLARFGGFALMWRWTGWHYKARWLIGADRIAASFFIMLRFHVPAVFLAAQVVFGLAAALIYSSSLYYAMHTSSGAGGHAGIHEALSGWASPWDPRWGAGRRRADGHGGAGKDRLGGDGGADAGDRGDDRDGGARSPEGEDGAMKKLWLGVLISGGGTTLQNIAECIGRGELQAQIVGVIASNERCLGIERAKRLGLRVQVITRKEAGTLDEFSRRIAARLREDHVDLALLTGFLSLWTIPADLMGRVMNIHPALLPKFGGRGMHGGHVHAAVLAAGERESGCTVHFADNSYDTGPIILQRQCPVLPEDTVDTLARRVFAEECAAYPEAIRLFAAGRVRMEDGRVVRGRG